MQQADQNHLAPEDESLSENIKVKVPDVNEEASSVDTKLKNRTTTSQLQEYLNETTPEKTDRDVTTDNTGIDRNTIDALNENNKYQEVLPGVVVTSPLKTALFWP